MFDEPESTVSRGSAMLVGTAASVQKGCAGRAANYFFGGGATNPIREKAFALSTSTILSAAMF